MMDGRCFKSKKKGYIAYDCSRKREVAAISEGVNKNNNSRGKE